MSKIALTTAPQDRASSLLVPQGFMDKPLEDDPMLQYLAATALYQEVKLLNTYVRDASIGDDQEAFIVRLQIGVAPRQRFEPYDVMTTLSFFPSSVTGPKDDDDAVQITRSVPMVEQLAITKRLPRGVRSQPVTVLPLLVTDNLEAAIASRNSQKVRELSLGILATLSGIGVSAGTTSAIEQLESLLSRDLNSVFMISRLSDNTVRIRLGASQIGQETYATTTRTHNVTLLVLVPKSKEVVAEDKTYWASQVEATARTVFVDAKTGVELPTAGRARLVAEVDALLVSHSIPKDSSTAIADPLLNAVQSARWDTFSETLAPTALDPTNARALWTEIADVASRERFAVVQINLPKPPKPALDQEETPLLIDDGITSSAIELHNGRDLDKILAHARASLQIAPTTGDRLVIASTSIQASADGRRLIMQFPSIKACRLLPSDGAATPIALGVSVAADKTIVAAADTGLVHVGDDSIVYLGYWNKVVYSLRNQSPEKPPVEVILDVTRLVVEPDETTTLRIALKPSSTAATKEIALRFVDARIAPTAAEPLKPKLAWRDDRWVVNSSSVMELPLTALKGAAQMQVIVLYDGKVLGEPLRLELFRPK